MNYSPFCWGSPGSPSRTPGGPHFEKALPWTMFKQTFLAATKHFPNLKPSVKTINDAAAALQDCLECTGWDVFGDDSTQEDRINREEYTIISDITHQQMC